MVNLVKVINISQYISSIMNYFYIYWPGRKKTHQRGIWADLQNLTKCYAIRKPEVGEARNSQETLPTLSAACVEHQTGADIVGLAVPHVRRDAIDTFQSQHGGRVFSAPDSGVAPLGSEMNSQVVCPQHIEGIWQKNVAFPPAAHVRAKNAFCPISAKRAIRKRSAIK